MLLLHLLASHACAAIPARCSAFGLKHLCVCCVCVVWGDGFGCPSKAQFCLQWHIQAREVSQLRGKSTPPPLPFPGERHALGSLLSSSPPPFVQGLLGLTPPKPVGSMKLSGLL